MRHTQQLFQVFWCNVNSLYIRFYQTHSGFSAQLAQQTLQRPDAGLSRIVGDHSADGVIADAQLTFLQSVLLQLLGQQMGLGDLQLLLVGVAAQLDDLHPVQQRAGDGGGGVGRGDEHHAAQVHRHLQKMVAE